MKKSHLIHHISLKDGKEFLNIKDELDKFNIVKNKYPFSIKVIGQSSELLHNFDLPRYTEFFFYKGILYIVDKHLQKEIIKIADSIFFIIPGNIKEKDLEEIFKIIKNENNEEYIKLIKTSGDKRDVKNFIVRDYLFKKKLDFKESESKFEYMMLKSKRIISNIKTLKMESKDLIEYILNKKF